MEVERSPGEYGPGATIEVGPPATSDLRISYAPDFDGAPDAGEVVWTWVPYAEHDGRGKDRPVLVIGRHGADRAYAVKLTSVSHDGDRDFLFVGPGDTVVTSAGGYPTFDFHVTGFGGELVRVPYRDDRQDPAALVAKAAETGARMVYLCNPDNPMGGWHPPEVIEAAQAAGVTMYFTGTRHFAH